MVFEVTRIKGAVLILVTAAFPNPVLPAHGSKVLKLVKNYNIL